MTTADSHNSLLPCPFLKLPPGAIRPGGWLLRQLEMQAAGFFGHLQELSRFLRKDGNAWLDPRGEGQHGWEEVPYWLRGYGDLGYVLDDKAIIGETRFWIEAALASQRSDGYFGPERNRCSPGGAYLTSGKPDLWSNMVMLNCLQSYFEFTGDRRVIDLFLRYCDWLARVPNEDFLVPYWQQQRGGDLLASLYWLYSHTGEAQLLDLSQRVFRHTTNWLEAIPDDHCVNLAQGFRGPATYYLQSHDRGHLEATYLRYDELMDRYGQMPGGAFAGDERARPGYHDPRQMLETCAMVEMMHSHQMLMRLTGDGVWADRCEEIAFNSLPAATTPDHRALRYLTACNMIASDTLDRAPAIYNDGPMTLFNPHGHRCCQHNWGFGWPYYAESLWYGTADRGLAAVMYCDCIVSARVGPGVTVRIEESTRYPFEESVRFHILPERPVQFPLVLRIPRWCHEPSLWINGNPGDPSRRRISGSGGNDYLVVDRLWQSGDVVELSLPMKVGTRRWPANGNSVSVYRGPLAFSLRIDEAWARIDGTEHVHPRNRNDRLSPEMKHAWPAWEVQARSPWNYGLVGVGSAEEPSFEVVAKAWPESHQPFALDSCPIELRTIGKLIPEWREDQRFHMPDPVPASPVPCGSLEETMTLVPMGAARLRITAFAVAD